MKNRIMGIIIFVGISLSSAVNAALIDLNLNHANGTFSINVTEGTNTLFNIGSMMFEGDGNILSHELAVIGEWNGMQDSIVIEQHIQYQYAGDPLLTPSYFTPILYADMNFTDSSGNCYTGLCENTYYDAVTSAGYTTESLGTQLDALYAIVALGDGIQRVDVSDFDDPGVMLDRHSSRIQSDNSLNVGMSFTDVMPGDVFNVTYRHLFSLGMSDVPVNFTTVPEPTTLMLLLIGLAGLGVSRGPKRTLLNSYK